MSAFRGLVMIQNDWTPQNEAVNIVSTKFDEFCGPFEHPQF